MAPELEVLRAKLAETELQLQRQKAQLQAKENTITNLRSRLSKAHDAFQAGNRA
jgi:molecular chaperone GrpE (heat shock protein)